VREMHHDILAAGISDTPIKEVVEADAMFHDLIGISSRNMFIESVIKSQNRLRRILEYQFHTYAETLELSCHEHLHETIVRSISQFASCKSDQNDYSWNVELQQAQVLD